MYQREDFANDLKKYAYYDKNCKGETLKRKLKEELGWEWGDFTKDLQDNIYSSCVTILSRLLDPQGALDTLGSIVAAKRKREFLSDQYITEQFGIAMDDYRIYVQDVLDNLKFIKGLKKIKYKKCSTNMIQLHLDYDIEKYKHLPFQCIYQDGKFLCPSIGQGLYLSIFGGPNDFLDIFKTVYEKEADTEKKSDNAKRYIMKGLHREKLECLDQESEWWDWYSRWIWVNHIDLKLISSIAEEIGKQEVGYSKNQEYIEQFLEILAGCYTPVIRRHIGNKVIPDFVECLQKDDDKKQKILEGGFKRLKKMIDDFNARLCLCTEIMLEISDMRKDNVLYPGMVYQFMEYRKRLGDDQHRVSDYPSVH